LTVNPAARLIPAQYLLTPNPERPLGRAVEQKKPEENGIINGVVDGVKQLTTS